MKALKFRIGNQPEITEAVQKTLFALGYEWEYYGQNVLKHTPFLYANADGTLGMSGYEDEPDFWREEAELIDLGG